jgi:hypothetical protein
MIRREESFVREEAERQDGSNALLPEPKSSHLDKVLRDLSHTLLAFMNHEVRPVYQFRVNLPVRDEDAIYMH